MNNFRAPFICPGQVYYDEQSNSYLVVTKKVGEMIRFQGQPPKGIVQWRGNMEDVDFIDRFQPVDPQDLDEAEKNQLTSFCEAGDQLKIGFIKGEQSD